MTTESRPLALILAVYFVLAALYAWYTPLWQAPDEPAHYNNVRHVVETGSLPFLHPGDYDQDYLEAIKARRFPPEMSIDSIRYEGHQPPLYYWLAAPLLLITQGMGYEIQVLALRLFSVFLGAGVVGFIWASARHLFPDKLLLATLAAGFAAFLPMHLAMMAAINNDALAELIIALGVYRLLVHLKYPRAGFSAWLVTGIVVGLGLLTKFQAYILLPLAGSVWLWQIWERRSLGVRLTSSLVNGLAWLAPALLLPLPWWLRNASLYGPTDPLGLTWHDAVVVGQPRTPAWIAAHGLPSYLDRYLDFTFKSFWGVFGWLGVFLDGRIYALFALLSLLVGVGLLFQAWRLRRKAVTLTLVQKLGLALLGLQLLIVLFTYFWYNLSFVQHQGRYLFPALTALSIGFALGYAGIISRKGSLWGALAAGVVLLATVAAGLLAGDINGWAALLAAAAVIALAVRHRYAVLPAWAWSAAILVLLALIDIYALFGAIVPQLGG
ncbi:MAG TPA: phospholipid carrier-dependent glycosyltransferase [Caldilineae bacterium]|nr:phospholipid carrier-dependent glycosyltransferase [Caldilineae bacterium]